MTTLQKSIDALDAEFSKADDLSAKADELPRDREELIAQAMTVFPGADVFEWLNAILAKHEQMTLVQATDWDSSSLHC